jgi:hypothetical protein
VNAQLDNSSGEIREFKQSSTKELKSKEQGAKVAANWRLQHCTKLGVYINYKD